MRRLLPDLSLVRRRREFRLLLAARTVSTLGSAFAMVGVPFQVYELTGSALAVGAVGIAETVPLVAVALYAGAMADAVDRRRMVVAAELGGAAVAALLLVNTALPDPQLWVMYLGAAAGTGCYALLRPPMDAIMPRTVAPGELTAASGLESIQHNLIEIAGPALAGLLLAATSVPVLFAVDLASFALSALILTRLPSYAPAEPRRVRPLADIRAGLAYARGRPDLLGSYGVDLIAMVFALPSALFVVLAPQLGGPEALGLLYAAPAAGALVFSLLSGPARHVRRHGRAIVLSAAGWGAAIAGFGLVDSLGPALALLALAGGFDAISALFRATLWNLTIPDELRGRLAGLEMISWGAGPGLGDLRAGAVASLTGVRASLVGGGVACVAGCGAMAAAVPALWRFEAPPGSATAAAAASGSGTPT